MSKLARYTIVAYSAQNEYCPTFHFPSASPSAGVTSQLFTSYLMTQGIKTIYFRKECTDTPLLHHGTPLLHPVTPPLHPVTVLLHLITPPIHPVSPICTLVTPCYSPDTPCYNSITPCNTPLTPCYRPGRVRPDQSRLQNTAPHQTKLDQTTPDHISKRQSLQF